MDVYLAVSTVVAAVLIALWWRSRRAPTAATDSAAIGADDDRLDTLVGWPPQATRILRKSERQAYDTLKLALPGYMILAQLQVARFITVPKRNSYGEWLRRVGSQCVDFVVCDPNSQVVAAIDIRPPESELGDRVRHRAARLDQTLKAAGVPIHVWHEHKLPSVEAARAMIRPNEGAVLAEAVAPRPFQDSSASDLAGAKPRPAAQAAVPGLLVQELSSPFDAGHRDPSADEVIEMPEPSSWTWFDDIESVPAPAPEPRPSRA